MELKGAVIHFEVILVVIIHIFKEFTSLLAKICSRICRKRWNSPSSILINLNFCYIRNPKK